MSQRFACELLVACMLHCREINTSESVVREWDPDRNWKRPAMTTAGRFALCRTSDLERLAAHSEQSEVVPGPALDDQIRHRLPDRRGKLEAVSRARAHDHHLRVLGVAVDDE